MPADISGFDYKVMPADIEIDGDQASGYHVVVPYLLPWAQAYTFVDAIMGLNSATTVGPITYKAPHRFPTATADLYATRFRIKPQGATEGPEPTYKGLAPGEYFTHAVVTVEYTSPGMRMEAGQGSLHQLDPANPLTVCRQSVKSASKMETIKSGHFVYTSDSKKVPGDYAVPTCESVLELEFPRVPYLPWQAVEPYMGRVNAGAMLGVAAQRLLLEGFGTREEATTGGWTQSVTLSFAVAPPGQTWNQLPRDGVPANVRRAGSSDGIYLTANFADIFDLLDREEA